MNLLNLARMRSSTVGAGSPLTLTTAISTYLSFVDAGGVDGLDYAYGIYDPPHREHGWGVLGGSGTTLTRNVMKSTNSNNPISLSGNAIVFITPLAEFVMGGGGVYAPFRRPVSGDFAWINQGGASVTVNSDGSNTILAPATAGTSIRLRKKTLPAPPYTITIALIASLPAVATALAGLFWRQSSDGKLISCVHYSNGAGLGGFACQDHTNETTGGVSNANIDHNSSGVLWLQAEDNNTNRIARYSADGGRTFHILFSEGRTVFMTADEIGIGVNAGGASWAASATVLSYKEG